MKEDSRQQVRLGPHPVRFTREADGIIAVPLFQARSCRAMIESVRGHERWDSAKVGARAPDGGTHSVVDPEFRTASVLFSEYMKMVCRKFDEKMNAVVKPLVERLWQRGLTDHSGTQLVRYSPGGHYRAHSDVGRRTRNRYYTVLCYLNDDFEGGRTHFPDLNYAVAPHCGKAILFPSRYQHCGEQVTSGEKYLLVSWITGPIPQD